MGFSKNSAKREAYSNTSLPQETTETSNKQLNLTHKVTRQRRKKTIISIRKEIIKSRADIIEKEIKETIKKINKTKNWFFKKIKLTNH